MGKVSLSVACGIYDRCRPIQDGRVTIEGCDVTFIPMGPEEVFFRAFRNEEFDVAELSFSSYLRTVADGTARYVGIPAFVSRLFRHSAIYVRPDRNIKVPADLKGKLVGVPEYQLTACVWARGMLQEEYGVTPSDIHWRSGGQEQTGRDERTPLKGIDGVDLQPIAADKTLVGMLRDGELDALLTAREPSSFSAHEPHIARLFSDTRAAEQAYYKKTGLFPIMHLVGIRKTLVEQHPWLPASVYKAFCEAKALAMREVLDVGILHATLPWLVAEALATQALMGRDFWRYGIKENLKEITTLARYSYEQGLIRRQLTPEDLFARSTFEISAI